MKTEDTEALGRHKARSKPDTVDQPVRTARTICTIIIVHNTVAQRQWR